MIAELALAAAFAEPMLLLRVTDPEVNESSGLAASLLSDGVFYTHNDSGDKPRFFRFDRAGKVTGVFDLTGAEARDWEDMAAAEVGGRPYLYLADVGDNAQVRESVVIYRVVEPTGPGRALTEFDRYEIRYPDKPRDCEAVFVEPETGHIWLVSKARDQVTVVYRLRRPLRSGAYTAERLGEIPVDTGGLGGTLVTGGDASADGSMVALRTYTGLLVYTVKDSFADWMDQEPVSVPGPRERQGEAVCFARHNYGLLTSSEGSPMPVSIIRILRDAGAPGPSEPGPAPEFGVRSDLLH